LLKIGASKDQHPRRRSSEWQSAGVRVPAQGVGMDFEEASSRARRKEEV